MTSIKQDTTDYEPWKIPIQDCEAKDRLNGSLASLQPAGPVGGTRFPGTLNYHDQRYFLF
jgi:hypothetical protein